MYYLMKDSGATANFSVILPGECNAACDFCFWKRNKAESPMFVQTLRWYLQALGSKITQISLTGGEPTISPVFNEVIEMLREFKNIKIVLTTNGHKLKSKVGVIAGVVKHVNISRHAVSDEGNYYVFKTHNVPDREALTELCEMLNKVNIDVTINKVIPHNYDDFGEFYEYIQFVKTIGASALALRKDYSVNSLDKVPLEAELGQAGTERSCPVCVTNSYLVKGVPVHFKMSLEEPSHSLPYIYEFVYHPNSLLSEDWAGKKPIKFQIRAQPTPIPTVNWSSASWSSGCGQRSFSNCGQVQPLGCGQRSIRSGC